MPGVNKQMVQAAVAAIGLMAVLGFMGHLMYSGAQRHLTNSLAESRPEAERTQRIREQVLEFQQVLGLTSAQAEFVEAGLRNHQYGQRDWRRRRSMFFFELEDILTTEQQEKLNMWLEEAHRRRTERVANQRGTQEASAITQPASESTLKDVETQE